jgi:hypothetical protein
MKTFLEFLEEAKRVKVLRTAHYTTASKINKEILDKGFVRTQHPPVHIILMIIKEQLFIPLHHPE